LRVAAIGLGCWLALALNSQKSSVSRLNGNLIRMAAPLLLLLALFCSQWQALQGLSWLLADVSAVCFLVSIHLHSNGFTNRILRSGVLALIGGISNELYLWNHIVIKIGVSATGMPEAILALWL
jgi:peptidoglycan/LPS O-acetylase OafA/YrhL